MTRKAQIIGEIFIYILAVVIATLVIIYGYSSIKGFIQKQKQIEIIQFKNDLQSTIRTVSTEYGSVKKFENMMPGEAICFIEISNYDIDSCICRKCPGKEWQYNPIICDAWQTTNDQNVFIIPQIETPILTPSLKIKDSSYLCIKAVNNKITLRLEGFGNHTEVSEWI